MDEKIMNLLNLERNICKIMKKLSKILYKLMNKFVKYNKKDKK